MICTDERGAFCYSVAIDEIKSDVGKELCDFRSYRSSAANNLFELAAETFKNEAEEFTAFVNTLSTKLVTLFDKLIELFLHALLFDVFNYALIHRLGNRRHNINV